MSKNSQQIVIAEENKIAVLKIIFKWGFKLSLPKYLNGYEAIM